MSNEQGARSREQGARSREQGASNNEQERHKSKATVSTEEWNATPD